MISLLERPVSSTGSKGFNPAEFTEEPLYTSLAHSAPLFTSVARAMGARVEPSDEAGWHVLNATAYAIDEMIDVNHQDVDGILADFFDGEPLVGASERVSLALRSYIESRPEQQQGLIKQRFMMIGSCVANCTEARTIEDLVKAKTAEADLWAGFLELWPSGEDTSQRKRFNTWLQVFGRAGYYIDTLVDLRQDYASGEANVKPTLRNHAVLARVSLQQTAILCSLTPLSAIPHVMKSGYDYEIANRELKEI